MDNQDNSGRDRCGTCFFSRPHKADMQMIECHQTKPSHFIIMGPTNRIQFASGFPVLPRDEWCGEYKVRPAALA